MPIEPIKPEITRILELLESGTFGKSEMQIIEVDYLYDSAENLLKIYINEKLDKKIVYNVLAVYDDVVSGYLFDEISADNNLNNQLVVQFSKLYQTFTWGMFNKKFALVPQNTPQSYILIPVDPGFQIDRAFAMVEVISDPNPEIV